MRKIILQNEIVVLIICFAVSRALVAWSGVTFQYEALFTYWQYLDTESLQHEPVRSVWFMHAQPPVFNLLAGLILQLSGPYARLVFQGVWMAISFLNACLLLRIIKSMLPNSYLPLIISVYYLISPATILYENELFYTSFTSMLLLLSVLSLNRFLRGKSGFSLAAFFASAVLLCLTRSMFHLLWLVVVCCIVLLKHYRKPGFLKVLAGSIASVLLVASWYAKNYLLFGVFSVSSWTGINFSRIVFHEVPAGELSGIATIHPFLPVSYYKPYISGAYRKQVAGMDDAVLLREMKSDTAINMNHAGYLEVSEQYMQASLDYIGQHPGSYAKNVLISFIIFFTPASSYFQVSANNQKLRLYDMVYSFNLSHLFDKEEDQKKALAVSAIPKCILYILVLFYAGRRMLQRRDIASTNACIIFTITFVLIISSLLDYGENMRFRYEVEPLFLVLLADMWSGRRNRVGKMFV